MLPTQTPLLPSSPKSAANGKVSTPYSTPPPTSARPAISGNSTPKNSRTPSASIPPALSSSQKPSFKRGSTAHQKLRPAAAKSSSLPEAAQATAIRNFFPTALPKPQLSACAKPCPWNSTPPKSPSTLTSSPPVPTRLPCWLPFVPPAVKSAPSSPSPSQSLSAAGSSPPIPTASPAGSFTSTIPIPRFRQAHSARKLSN